MEGDMNHNFYYDIIFSEGEGDFVTMVKLTRPSRIWITSLIIHPLKVGEHGKIILKQVEKYSLV